MIYGSVMGSFCCEKFGVDRFRTLTRAEIDARFEEFKQLHRVLSPAHELAGVLADRGFLLLALSARRGVRGVTARATPSITATRKRT